MPALPPPAVRALLRHYARVAREDLSFRARAQNSWLVGADGQLPRVIGVANRTAHQVLATRPAVTAQHWRAEWRAHGLLRPNGREEFTGCILLPLIPLDASRLSLAALPLAALTDPRTVPVRSTGPGWLDLATGCAGTGAVRYACSDPFDAVVLQAAGLPALALVDDQALAPAWTRLTVRLHRLHPRRLCLTCAATTPGERIADRWRDLAAAAGIPVDALSLPSGCTLRDVAHGARPAAAAALHALVDRRAVPRPAARPPSNHADRLVGPWQSDRAPLAADLSVYLSALRTVGRSRDERRRTAGALGRFWHFCVGLGLRRTTAFQRRHLERFQASLAGERADSAGMTAGAIARTVAALRGFLRWAVSTGRTQQDLATALAVVRRPLPVPPRVLGVREIERTMAAIPHGRPVGLRDRAMLEVLYATGIRRGELVGLEVADVAVSALTLRVRRGKGGTTRVVPLTRRAAAWLQQYIERARPRHLADLAEPALFVSRRGRRLTPKQVTCRMHACWAAAGLAHAGSCHVVRHSVATLMHDRGADIRDLQALLGHALLTSTQLYTRVSMQRLHEVHRRTHPGAGEDSEALPLP